MRIRDGELDLDTVSDDARRVIEEIRWFEIATHKIWLDRTLGVTSRIDRTLAVMRWARRASPPELCCHAVERAVLAHIFGSDPDATYWRTAIEESIAREFDGRAA
jgi:hypothetical protein